MREKHRPKGLDIATRKDFERTEFPDKEFFGKVIYSQKKIQKMDLVHINQNQLVLFIRLFFHSILIGFVVWFLRCLGGKSFKYLTQSMWGYIFRDIQYIIYWQNTVSGKTVDEYKRWSADNKVLIAREGPGMKANFKLDCHLDNKYFNCTVSLSK